VLGYLKQLLGSVKDAVDPVGASRKGDVAVGIDHPWDNGRTSRVNHIHVLWEVALIGRGMDPDYAAMGHQDAYALSKDRSCTVREGRISI
jgi:hypothetical protein